jgi:putative peptidoglycan lipid II flippase
VQVPGLFRYQFRWKPAIDLRHPGVQKVLILLGPRVATVFCIQLTYLAQDNIASRLEAGTVSALVYGWLFMQVPETLIGTAIATALLPTISELFARRDQVAFTQTLNHSLRVILALTLPIAALVAVGIPPFVSFLGGTAAEQQMIVWSTRLFLVGLAGHALLEVGSRSFYAQQKALVPLLASALTLAVFIPLAAGLAKALSAPGIALANSLAFTGEALLLWFWLNRSYPGVIRTRGALGRALLAAVLGALLAFLVSLLPFSPLLLSLAGMALGALVTLPFIWPELKILIHL